MSRTSSGSSRANRSRLFRITFLLVLLSLPFSAVLAQSPDAGWRAATPKELQSLLPARATVVKEHIETEMRSASGITDGHGHFIAGVVLITAGYSADGKYSHYLVVQAPIKIGGLALPPGEYVLGWQRDTDALDVHFYDAATGTPRGDARATRIQGDTRVVSFEIWPPQSKSIIQIGRFGIPYRLRK
ncbi:MAG TPA: hypothetical protein VHY48_06075 [Acidobacteriaceae bacterium]|jgi:hypothetical protein|nr:hypothetical protein [Acidobacteriaceae bacterium]